MAPRSRNSCANTAISEGHYRQQRAWGLATSIDIYGCDPAIISSKPHIELFAKELCALLKVRMYGPTQIVRFGDEPRVYGYSMVQLIETSLVSAHFAEDSNAVYLDIFSCQYYDAEKAANYARDFFRGTRLVLHSCVRA